MKISHKEFDEWWEDFRVTYYPLNAEWIELHFTDHHPLSRRVPIRPRAWTDGRPFRYSEGAEYNRKAYLAVLSRMTVGDFTPTESFNYDLYGSDETPFLTPLNGRYYASYDQKNFERLYNLKKIRL